MKNHLLIVIFFMIILSCTHKTDHSSFSGKTLTKDSLIIQTETMEMKINRTLPFGCSYLTKFKYPKTWERDLENYGRLKQPQSQSFENIGKCLAEINKMETSKILPKILQVNHIKIGEDFKNAVYFDTITQQNIYSLKYRLPNLGIYECYYYFEQSKKMHGDYGTLLLLDPKLKTGKTLNIYYEVGGDQHVDFRYFFIDGKTIKIYEGSCYDDGCHLMERFTVNIMADGKIIINELK